MARVGAARMAQNSQRTLLILMFEKIVFWCFFWYKMYENILVDSLDLIREVSRKKIGPNLEIFSKIGRFLVKHPV